MLKWKKVQVGKIDLDTVGCGYLLEVSRKDLVEVLREGIATEEDLADPTVLCIEVGGAGRVNQNNFDHHEAGGPVESASLQAFEAKFETGCNSWGRSDNEVWRGMKALAEYINIVDTVGFGASPLQQEDRQFPHLSNVFAGMLLTEREPVQQFYKGIELLEEIIRSGQDPSKAIKGFDLYVVAKMENNRKLAEAVKNAEWTQTIHGRTLAYLKTDSIGVPGALYAQGADVVVAYSPKYGSPPVPKFTIAAKNAKILKILSLLNDLEAGWGGPATGTIVGSPRTGSRLSLEQVVEIARAVL